MPESILNIKFIEGIKIANKAFSKNMKEIEIYLRYLLDFDDVFITDVQTNFEQMKDSQAIESLIKISKESQPVTSYSWL